MDNIIDKKFGRLTAKECVGKNKNYKPLWKCICDCGEEKIVDVYSLKSGSVISCGCAVKEGKNKIDMIGKRFGMLVVLEESEYRGKNKKSIYYKCKCDCGNIKDILGTSLRRNKRSVRSCGCNHPRKTHGLSKTRIYKIWENMKQRCLNENEVNFKNYGHRGIEVCQEWLDEKYGFFNFYNWALENNYSDILTIDRIDVNRNYEPENCRWVDKKTQANNRRVNKFIEYNGEIKTISEWADQYEINYITLVKRLNSGWDIERCLFEEIQTKDYNKKICIEGECHTYKEWSEITGIKINTLRGRFHKGLRGKDLIREIKEGRVNNG